MNLPIVSVYLAPYAAVLLSASLSLAHAGEELWGEGASLGDYMSRLWGLPWLRRPLDIGVLLLPFALIAVASLAYGRLSREAMIVLAAWRWFDCAVMHWLPSLARWPNPGFWSSLPCGFEASAITLWLV